MKKSDREFAARLALVIESGRELRLPKQVRVATERLAILLSSSGKQKRPD